jgi:hypothetical protein
MSQGGFFPLFRLLRVWLDTYIYASLTPATEQVEIDLRIRPLHPPSHICILALLVLVRSSDHGQRGLLLSPNGKFPKLLDLWISRMWILWLAFSLRGVPCRLPNIQIRADEIPFSFHLLFRFAAYRWVPNSFRPACWL